MRDIQSVIVPLAGKRAMHRHRAAGFTLIELMMVVVVVAILSSIAIPAYQDSVRKARRAQAKADMLEYAGLAERFRTVNNSYADFDMPLDVSPREDGATVRYDLATNTVFNDNDFVITATPEGSQAKDKCGVLTIANTGEKTAAGPAPLADCW